MIKIHVDRVNNIISNYKDEIESQANNLKKELLRLLFNPLIKDTWQVKYINHILDLKDRIITLSPNEIESIKDDFNKIIPVNEIKKQENSVFRNILIESMGYKKLRDSFYPKYFHSIGIKACVYCNSQLAIVAEAEIKVGTKTVRVTKAKFQVDHYIPKSEYPCLSISLFNLIPSCASCNNVKGEKHVIFNLYCTESLETMISKYEFKISNLSIPKYILLHNPELLHIEFVDPDTSNRNLNTYSLKDIFHIEGIYETQKDVVEELIAKSLIYNDAYKKKLVHSFGQLFTFASLSDRLLVGNYTEPQNIHKRPMAKFTQDIARQLKLIE